MYDIHMKKLPEFIEQNKIQVVFEDKKAQQHYVNALKKVSKGVDTWDYQWAFTIMTQNGLCIIPNVNLVANIGFGVDSTHAINKDDKLANIEAKHLGKIVDPAQVLVDREADNFTGREAFQPPPLLLRIQNKLSNVNNSIDY